MPASVECVYKRRKISVEEALRIKELSGGDSSSELFTCPECANPVKPHQAGGRGAAHFEHFERISTCSLSPKSKDNNPDWMRDELIVALDCYLQHRPNPPGKTSAEISELSATLRKLATRLHPFLKQSPTFRNTNGVYMKLMNFRRLDPVYTASQTAGGLKKGLERGAAGDEAVWNEFAANPRLCGEVAKAIIAGVEGDNDSELDGSIHYDIEEAPEGRLLTRTHVFRERSPRLVAAKVESALKAHGKLECEVCKFDYSRKYGAHGAGYIECHHTLPLATLLPGTKTKLKDLALVCSNCHRMLHRKKKWLSIEDLQKLINT